MPCKFACIKSFIIALALLASVRAPRIEEFPWAVLLCVQTQNSRSLRPWTLQMRLPKPAQAMALPLPWGLEILAAMEKGIIGCSRICFSD